MQDCFSARDERLRHPLLRAFSDVLGDIFKLMRISMDHGIGFGFLTLQFVAQAGSLSLMVVTMPSLFPRETLILPCHGQLEVSFNSASLSATKSSISQREKNKRTSNWTEILFCVYLMIPEVTANPSQQIATFGGQQAHANNSVRLGRSVSVEASWYTYCI